MTYTAAAMSSAARVGQTFLQTVNEPEPNAGFLQGFQDRVQDLVQGVLSKLAEGVEPQRPDLNDIRTSYQTVDDTITEYRPQFGPFPIDIPFVGGRRMTQTEADLLNQLGDRRGLSGLNQFQNISSNNQEDPGLAYLTADERVPQVDEDGNFIIGGEDGHNDAFRHAYWNALMVDRFGEGFASAFGTAHEGVPDNPANKEAMDLYNNEVGRTIALENPGASDAELADLVQKALNDGELIVIDASNDLAWSDQVEIGKTGTANSDAPIDGTIAPPEWESN